MTDAGEKAERVAGAVMEKRHEHLQRAAPYRIMWVVAAFIVTAAGLVMIVVPGPAVIVIPVGLAMLSLEFAWAARLTRLRCRLLTPSGGIQRRRWRRKVLQECLQPVVWRSLLASGDLGCRERRWRERALSRLDTISGAFLCRLTWRRRGISSEMPTARIAGRSRREAAAVERLVRVEPRRI